MPTKAETLANEICHVFISVENVIPDLAEHALGANEIGWLPLRKASRDQEQPQSLPQIVSYL